MTKKTYTSVDPTPLSKTVTVALFAHLATTTAYLAGNAWLLPKLSGPLDPATLGPVGMYLSVTGLASLVTNCVLAGLVLAWIHRTSTNAHAFARKTLEMTPAWQIIWFFVPVASLWMPFQGVEQTWRVSKDPWNFRRVATPNILVWWWRLLVLVTLIGTWAALLNNAKTLDALAFATQVRLVGAALVIPLDLMFLKIVRDLTLLQANQVAYGAFDDGPAPLGAAASGGGVVGAQG